MGYVNDLRPRQERSDLESKGSVEVAPFLKNTQRVWCESGGGVTGTVDVLEVFKRPSTNVKDKVSSVQSFIAFIQFDSFTFVLYFTIQTELIPVDQNK